MHERLRRALLVEHLGAVFVAAAVALLFGSRQDVDRLLGSVVVGEESPRVEQPRVDLGWRQVPDAHDVNLRGSPSRRHRFGALHLLEQLLHGVEQRVVLGGAEHLRHEPSALAEKLRGEAERVERERRLRVRLGGEVAADVWSAVVHDDVVLGTVRGDPAKLRAARLRGDVVHEGGAPAYGLDWREVDAHDERRHRHVLLRHLEPTAGGGAEVHARARAAEEVILAVELDELERRARAEALLLGEVVELICSGRRRAGWGERASERVGACNSSRVFRRRAAVGGDATGWGDAREVEGVASGTHLSDAFPWLSFPSCVTHRRRARARFWLGRECRRCSSVEVSERVRQV